MTRANESLVEFLDRRESEIRALRAELLLELKQIKAAKQVVSPREDEGGASLPAKAPSEKMTIKQMVVEVLKDAGRGQSAESIVDLIWSRFGVEAVSYTHLTLPTNREV